MIDLKLTPQEIAESLKYPSPMLRPLSRRCDLICENSANWVGSGIDIVCTNPYDYLPTSLLGLPSIISLYMARNDKRDMQATAWLGGAELKFISKWGAGLRNSVFVANLPAMSIDLSHLVEDHTDAPPHEGWFPLELPMTLLTRYARAGMVVWDGFAGRGTTGKACKILNMGFVGIDKVPWRVELMRKYIDGETEEKMQPSGVRTDP